MPLVKIEPYSANSSADFTFNNLIVTGNLYSNYSNSAFQTANSAGVYANAAFAQANSGSGGASGSYANSAYLQANSAYLSQNSTGNYANSAYGIANSAFTAANTANTNAISAGSYANSAFALANSVAAGSVDSWARNATNAASSYANSGFVQANTSNTNAISAGSYANSAYAFANTINTYSYGVNDLQNTNITSASSYANGAFLTANASANYITLGTANSAASYANAAFQAANSAGVYANAAFAQANSGSGGASGSYANSAYQAANSAGVYANAAFAAANSGSGADSWARSAANSASSYANSAYTKANNALANTTGTFAGDLTVSGNLVANTITSTGTLGTISGVNVIYSNTFLANGGIIFSDGSTQNTAASNSYFYGVNAQQNTNISTANSTANAAFATANNSNVVNITQNTNITSAASYANGAFAQANVSISAASYANGAFATANNANVVNITQNTNITSAASYANGAFQAANSAGSYANSAYAAANTGSPDSLARSTANSASSYANGAFQAANSAGSYANSAYLTANSAGSYANSAFLKANNALANTTGTFGGTLTVAGTLNADGLSITGTGGTISALNLIYSNTIFANSNVGIGVTTTSAKLDLGGTGVEIPQIIWSRGSDDSAFISKLKTGNTGTSAVQSSIGLDYLNDFAAIKFYRASTAGEIHFYTGSTGAIGTEKMRLNSTGLGIGTSSPSTILEVSSATPVVTVTGTGTTASSQNFTNNGAAQRTTIGVERASGGGLFVGSSANAAVFGSAGAAVTQFATNNNVRVTIDTSGYVGIGTNAPGMPLEVVGEIKTGRVNSSAEGGQLSFGRSTDNANAWFIDVYGSSATPDIRLLNASGVGVTIVNGASAWSTYSDEKLKTNLKPIENAISILNSIRCVTYHRKDIDIPESKRRIGIIAQDIVGKIDEALDNVTNEIDGIDYLSVRYTELVPHLIKGIQEQQALIESLTTRLTALENK